MICDILFVEDNKELAELISAFLERDGYSVVRKESGEAALSFLRADPANHARLILLDVMLSGMDGFAFCAAIRKDSNVPIIMLSARTEKEDQMTGFEQGADDYLEKPVDVDILSAKIGALMRRNYELHQNNPLIKSGALTIDKDARRVFLHGRELSMTGKEFELLVLFAENPGRTLSKEFLFNQIWGVDSFSENQTLTVHVRMLRDKIEENPGKPERIKTIWGVGYRYEEN